MAYVAPSTVRTTGEIVTAGDWNQYIGTNEALLATSGFTYRIDGSGVAITTGVKSAIEVPFTCTLTQIALYADVQGSIAVDMWKYAGGASWNPGTHPVDGDSICSGSVPTITTAKEYVDATLSSWTKAWTKGDQIMFNVDSCTTITWCNVCAQVTM
jgi:hypothetical protein